MGHKGGIILYLDKAKDASKKSFKIMVTYIIISQLLILLRSRVMYIDDNIFFNAIEYKAAFLSLTYIAEIFAGGLILAVVPSLIKAKVEGGEEERLRFTNNIVNITLIVSLIIMFFGYIYSENIIRWNNINLSEVDMIKSIKLFRTGLPMILVILLKPIHLGFLVSKHAFKAGVKGGVSYNLVLLGFLLFFKNFGQEGFMIATVLAYISYYFIIANIIKNFDYKYKWVLDFKDPKLKGFILSFLFITIFQFLKINIFKLDINLISKSFSLTGFYGNAIYILELVMAIVMTVVATIVYPLFAETFYEKREEEFKIILNKAIEIMTKVLMPISILLILFAEPTTRLFFDHGNAFLFKDKLLSSYEIIGTVKSLRFIGIGLLFLGFNMIFIRVFFAREKYLFPIMTILLGTVLNYGLAYLLYQIMGESGIALSGSLTAIVVGLILVYRLNTANLIDYKGFIETLGVSSMLGIFVMGIVFVTYRALGETDIATIVSYSTGIFIYLQLNKDTQKLLFG